MSQGALEVAVQERMPSPSLYTLTFCGGGGFIPLAAAVKLSAEGFSKIAGDAPGIEEAGM